ncbi:TldD/PmbA family protein [Bdellovibrio svalbardensis]|uniref:TldD/PmbA family protein n=1 Tax=Bdellovibrio svalbardensis TaxID=2972972 RepID=A0ABT6DN11_9BACT|nr:TldD/PmbA family protein [Bdellovibrio svalbardensis]MDG0818031.1 TldD/PmbA family protein [Bdellovibrio svalbardensis]
MDAIKENFQKIVSEAQRDGAKVEMLISGGESLKLGFQQKKLEKFESTQSQMAGLRVILGANQGYAYTENLSLEALLRTYNDALNNAKTVQSEDAVEVPLVKPQVIPSLNLFNPEEIPMDKKMEVARSLEECCLNADARIQSVPYCGFNESISFRRVLNSEGLDQEFKQNYYTGYAYPLAKEGESSKMDGEGFFARSFKDIDAKEVAEEGVRKSISRLGAQKLKTGNYAVVIDREQFTTILTMISGYLSAKEVHENKSLLKGKLGQKIASEKFQLIDDALNVRGTSVRPFDSEGAPSQTTVLFENGVLKNYLTNLEYAKKMNLPHTAHAARSPASAMDIGPTNMIVAKGDKTLPELLSKYDKVVHLMEFSGALHSGFKESTGDFSMPAEGFLYENGKCMGPVDQFVMSGNVLDLLRDIDELGNEYNKEGNSLIAPDVLVKSLSFAGA